MLFICMMPLYSRNNKLIGYLKDISPYKKSIFDRKGTLLGWYNPAIDKTFNASGKLIANKGDLRANLLAKTV